MDYRLPLRWALRDWFVAVTVDEHGKRLQSKEIERRCGLFRTDIARFEKAGEVGPDLVERVARAMGVAMPAFAVSSGEPGAAPVVTLVRRAIAALQEAEERLRVAGATEEPDALRAAVSGALSEIAHPSGRETQVPGKAGRRRGSPG